MTPPVQQFWIQFTAYLTISESLNKDPCIVNDWFKHKVSLKANMYNDMLFHSNRNRVQSSNLKIDDGTRERVTKFNLFLG